MRPSRRRFSIHYSPIADHPVLQSVVPWSCGLMSWLLALSLSPVPVVPLSRGPVVFFADSNYEHSSNSR